MKKGPLSNKEKEFIQQNSSNSIDELSKTMNRSTSIIESYLVKISDSSGHAHSLYARKIDRGVTVMTEEASTASDENKTKPLSAPKRYTNVIHKIKE